MNNLTDRFSGEAAQLSAVLAILLGCSPTWAGPPLSIDDPDILDPWQFEIITALTMTSTDGGDFHELPIIDVSLGIVEDYLQASAGLPYVVAAPNGGRTARDFGNASFGLKFRFVNSDRLQVAFAPAYVFGVADGDAEKGVGDSANFSVYPINAEYQVSDKWRLNGELSYARSDQGDKEWGYGVAIAHVLDERRELLFEISGSADSFLGSEFMQMRAGIDSALTDSLHILFSVGTSLRTPVLEEDTKLDVFLGLKLLL